MIAMRSDTVSEIQMSVLARWQIRPRLMSIPGVANVSVWGMRDRQLQVQVDPQRLQSRKVTLTQLIESTGNALWVSPLSFVEASTPGTGGFVETPQQRLGVRRHVAWGRHVRRHRVHHHLHHAEARHQPAPQQQAADSCQRSGDYQAGEGAQRADAAAVCRQTVGHPHRGV